MKYKFLTSVILVFGLLLSINHQAFADSGDNGQGSVAAGQPAAPSDNSAAGANANQNNAAANPVPAVNTAPASTQPAAPAPQPSQQSQDPATVPGLQITPGFVLDPGPDPSDRQNFAKQASSAGGQNKTAQNQNVSFNFKQLQTVPQQAANTLKNLPGNFIASLAGRDPASGYNYDLHKLSPQTTKVLYGAALLLALAGIYLAARSRRTNNQQIYEHQADGLQQFEIN